MWKRFSEAARRAFHVYRPQEAARLGAETLATEALLLGLIREPDNGAARLLDRLGIALGRLQAALEQPPSAGIAAPTRDLPTSSRVREVLDLAYAEAEDQEIGTEHLLLGVIRQKESAAARLLVSLGATETRTRLELQGMRAGREPDEEAFDEDPDAHGVSEYLRLHGMIRRDPRHGQRRVMGVYHLPYFPDTLLVEALVFQSPDWVDFSEWFPYQPPADHPEMPLGLAHFYFDADGRELIGSYLSPPPPDRSREPACSSLPRRAVSWSARLFTPSRRPPRSRSASSASSG
jgi:hypothetical protein